MKSRWNRALLCVGFAVVLAGGCGSAGEEKPGDDGVAAVHGKIHRESDGSVILTFGDDALRRLALHVTELAAVPLAPEREAYGRVLDPAPFVALLGEVGAAKAALDAATSELARSRRLASDQNASARTVEAAVVSETQTRAHYEDAHARLLLGWGRDLTLRTDLPELVPALISGDAALVRVDVPSGRSVTPRGVHLAFPDSVGETITAGLVGSAPDVDPRIQGQAFLVVVRPNPARLLPGAFVSAFLELEGRSVEAALVPRDAIVRTESKAWVYVRDADAASFHRVEVSLDRATQAGWLVAHGVKPGDVVVVEGAGQLLSEEALANADVTD